MRLVSWVAVYIYSVSYGVIIVSAAAREILRRYWDGFLPVNPAEIARNMDIEVISNPSMGHSGHYRFNYGQPVIEYNSTEARVRQRFTIAHELGHHVNGDIDAPRDTAASFSARTWDPAEVEANRFAAALLMPDYVVRALVYDEGITNIEDLAEEFGVSTVAMKYRLENLGIL